MNLIIVMYNDLNTALGRNLFSIANDCSVNPSDLSKMLVKKQLKYFDVPLDHAWTGKFRFYKNFLIIQEPIIYMLKDSMIT